MPSVLIGTYLRGDNKFAGTIDELTIDLKKNASATRKRQRKDG